MTQYLKFSQLISYIKNLVTFPFSVYLDFIGKLHTLFFVRMNYTPFNEF